MKSDIIFNKNPETNRLNVTITTERLVMESTRPAHLCHYKKLFMNSENMLKVMDGEEVNKTKGSGFTSITAFTPHIKSNIKNIKKSNINIAYSYDEANNKTLMWLATPIIMNGY